MFKHKFSDVILIIGKDSGIEGLFRQFAKTSLNIGRLFSDSTIKSIKLVVFTGGEDVHPKLYNGTDCGISMTNIRRDLFERYIFNRCIDNNIKTTGICRGFQFLNVMAGGFMYQHIEGHAGQSHSITYPNLGISYKATSTHHQLVGLPDSALPIAWSTINLSKQYIGMYGKLCEGPSKEIEAAIFPKFNSMGVQFHPEFVGKLDFSRIHYLNMIEKFLSKDINDFIEEYAIRREANDKKARKREASDNRD